MILSALAFSVMNALVKGVGTRIPSQEIVFARALVSVVLTLVMLARIQVPIFGENKVLLLLRGIFGFCGLSCVFFAVTRLPLAEATLLTYLHPVFTAILAAIFLKERVGRGVAMGVGLSLLGMLFVAKPTFLFGGSSNLDGVAMLAAVAGAFFAGCAYVCVRKLGATEHPLVIVLYFPMVAVLSAPATVPLMADQAVWPMGLEWLFLLGVGVAAQVGQVALTRGMQHEPAGRATALSYLQVVFAAVWGAAFFGELPDAATAIGAGFILVGAFAAGRRP
jgi:drug/metabolite transporter (DMT)-like permease